MDLADLLFRAYILPPLEVLTKGRIAALVGVLILGVDLTLSTLAQEVADELPKDRGPALLTDLDGVVKLGEEVFGEENLYGFHGIIVSDRRC